MPIEINKYYTINGRRLVAQHLRIMGTWVGGNQCTQECITTKDICYLILNRVLQQQWRGFGGPAKDHEVKIVKRK